MRRFFIDPTAVTKPLATLKGSEAHHIRNVLRLKPGDCIKLVDGTGCEYEAAIKTLDAEKVEIEIRHEFKPPVTAGVRILVAQAFLKEKKMDDLVRKLSELGIAGWIPFFSNRSIARPDKGRLVGRTRRWQRIAAEAVKQCRRSDMLRIYEAVSFSEVLQFSKSCDLKMVFWENETAPPNRAFGLKGVGPLKKILLMLGPEGGFTEQEIETARQAGFATAGLGPRILRAETATLAACTLIQYIYGDMGPAVDQKDQKNLDKDSGV
jgi:16S rRNA (uracil1498-N3)-methyltransferase